MEWARLFLTAFALVGISARSTWQVDETSEASKDKVLKDKSRDDAQVASVPLMSRIPCSELKPRPTGAGLLPPQGRCKCSFVDVGLNNGQSLQEWPLRAVNKIEEGKRLHGMKSCLSPQRRNNTVCWFGFEANPAFTPQIEKLEVDVRATGDHAKLFTETVFNVDGSAAEFFIDVEKRGLGSSLLSSKTFISFVNGTAGWHRGTSTERAGYKKRCTRGVSAPTFLSTIAAASDHLYVKIDIEGYEYVLLPPLLEKGGHGLCKADLLAVEWHEAMAPKYKGQTAKLKSQLRGHGCGIKSVIDWD